MEWIIDALQGISTLYVMLYYTFDALSQLQNVRGMIFILVVE